MATNAAVTYDKKAKLDPLKPLAPLNNDPTGNDSKLVDGAMGSSYSTQAVGPAAAPTAATAPVTGGGDPLPAPTAASSPATGGGSPLVDGALAAPTQAPAIATGGGSTAVAQTVGPVTGGGDPLPIVDGAISPAPPTQSPAAVAVPDASAPAAATPPATQPDHSGAAWNPETGLAGSIEQAGVVDATATGYGTQGAGEAQGATGTGYEANTYDATKLNENLSQAIARIIDEGGPLSQRAQAGAAAQANERGLINTTMGAQAGQAALLDSATTIGQGDVQAGMFNAQQANDASRFSADAKNQASAFSANAKNMAEQFTSAEANKMAMFAAEQYNKAAEFAAAAQNAASSQNAAQHSQAMQRYTDAVNAAKAAEQDAWNLAKRDAATFEQQQKITEMQTAAQVQAAGISASATMGAAQLNATTQANALAAQKEQFAAQLKQSGHQFDVSTQMSIDQMGQQAFTQFQSGYTALMTADLPADARQTAVSNYMSVWAGNPYLPVEIDLSAFPPASGTGP